MAHLMDTFIIWIDRVIAAWVTYCADPVHCLCTDAWAAGYDEFCLQSLLFDEDLIDNNG
jgi:hypothetical protein